MIILGITNNDLASACLVKNGQIVSAVSEERFTRRKDDKVWPAQSISHVLRSGEVALDQVDYVAYGWNAGFDAEKHLVLYFDRILEEAQHNPDGVPFFRKRIADEIRNDKEKRKEFDDFIQRNNLQAKTIYIDHHECHALGAFVCSPYQNALVMTCDGRGDFQSLTVSYYDGENDSVLQRETTVDSLGYFYGRITKLLGYKPNRHEGKITGLAAFGDAERLLPLMKSMIDVENGRLRARSGLSFEPSYDGYSDELESMLAHEKPEDIAAAAQLHTENLLVEIIKHHILDQGPNNVCLAGGVFGNVKLNQRIREIDGVSDVYVLPCMGDGGLALAAAVGTAYLKRGSRFKNPSMKLGPDVIGTQACQSLLEQDYPDLACHQPSDMTATLIEALSANQVLGVIKGRMEFGPRALCNRSIVYHTADKSINDWLNKRMHRTEFMPFAPVTAQEHATECYIAWADNQVAADYMTMTYDCYPEFIESCPAVVHIDGTARPQIIRVNDDPFMHKLLHAWKRESGQAALINTSFNKHEEPIVCTAQDALDALREDMVDIVVLNESLLVWKKGKNDFAKRHLE
ncbi:carbamoyltransferase C-terminal domain-containing protein [Chromobacterium vaccinii]|uniref:Carbamoyltransferase C-terminal domain-containing protein n=1 Tax=Chromobacterium vaccinii TaxID=1108595 RepID=A0ABV0FER9_9NEIS